MQRTATAVRKDGQIRTASRVAGRIDSVKTNGSRRSRKEMPVSHESRLVMTFPKIPIAFGPSATADRLPKRLMALHAFTHYGWRKSGFLRILHALILGSVAISTVLADPPKLARIEMVRDPSPAYRHDRELTAATQRMLRAGDKDGLEKTAAELRKSRESFVSGVWLLSTFYSAAVYVPNDEKGAHASVEYYKYWAHERPNSITAQVCLAKALLTYAWNAHPDSASKGSKEEWRIYNERLAESWDVLQRAAKLKEKCPERYAIAQRVALSQGWKTEKYLELTSEAIKQEPTFYQYQENAARFLSPSWYGAPGDLAKWMAAQADTFPIAESDRQYARFVWLADCGRLHNQVVFAPDRMDWSRTQHGFDVWLQEIPGNLSVLSEYARLALFANDRDTARATFEKLGGKYLPGIWNDDVSNFEEARKFAFEWGRNPIYSSKPRSTGFNLPPNVIATVAVVLKRLGGFIGGILVGALLLILATRFKKIPAGLAAFAACVLVATPFGTFATLIPAAGLLLYLRRKNIPPVPIGPPSPRWWVVLLWVLGISVLNFGLQFGALILALIAPILKDGPRGVNAALLGMFGNGTAFFITINAIWICLLALIAICCPQKEGWRKRLGLQRCAIFSALPWLLLAAIVLLGISYFADLFADARTRMAVELIGQGIHAPVIFFLTLVFAAPVAEELTFRGYAYSGWIDKFGFWGTAVASTCIFTFCHIQYGWLGLLNTFIFGMMLSLLRRKTGSVYPCMALHMSYNFAIFLGAYFTQRHT